jgi:predicted ATPase/class 3 adenylate cyclase
LTTATATGTITLAFSDIEGSTRLLQTLGDGYADLLLRHREVVRRAVGQVNGRVIQEVGDGFFLSFGRARDAILAAATAQREIAETRFPGEGQVRVRMGIHTGEPAVWGDGFIGLDVHRAARICSAAVGGQVLLSKVTADLTRGELPDGVTIKDLGTHRLKDLYEPEHLFQLAIEGLRSDFPPPRTLEARRFNFPAPPTRLIGRDRDIDAVSSILSDGRARLVTLTGPGGTGKTRLSLAVADLAADRFDDGAAFVGLANVSDPTLIPGSIARSLGLRESAARTTFDVVVEHLREREMLLVLDNFEQVVDGAHVVADLLGACPCVSVLVTSRIVLRIRGEHEFPVPTLVLPDPGARPEILRVSPAVMLFVERARAVRPEFELDDANAGVVAELCTRLDGLPLALELAAARIRLFTPQALLARLGRRLDLLQGGARDLPERHQTLRAAIGWSYDLLSAPEKELFRRLAVFSGSFTIDHAEAVCRSAETGSDVLTGLGALVERSLIRRESDLNGESRFGMLETVRAFGLEVLEEAGEAVAAREAHARLMLDIVTEAQPHLAGPNQQYWLDRLGAEHDNLRTACDWFAKHDGDAALQMCAALYRFWIVRGHLREGRRTSEHVLSLPGTSARTTARARITFGLGTFYHETGDFRLARRLLEESLTIATELDDAPGIAAAANGVAWVLAMVGDTDASRPLAEHALHLNRQLGDRRGEAVSLHNLGIATFWKGDPETARAYYAEAIPIMESLGDQRGVAYYSTNLSWIDCFQGRLADARQRLEEAAVSLAMLRDTQLIGWAFSHQARLAFLHGDVDASIRTFEEAIGLWREVGNRFGIAWTLGHYARALIEKGDVDTAATLLRESLQIWNDSGSLRGKAMISGALVPYVALTQDPEARRALTEGLRHAAEISDVPAMIEALEEALPYLAAFAPPERTTAFVALLDATSKRLARVPTPRQKRIATQVAGTVHATLQTEEDADDGVQRAGSLEDATIACAEIFSSRDPRQ